MEISLNEIDKEQTEMSVRIENMYNFFKGKKILTLNKLFGLRRKYKEKKRHLSKLQQVSKNFSYYFSRYFDNKKQIVKSNIDAIDTAIEICELLEVKKTTFIKKQILKKDIVRQIAKLKLIKVKSENETKKPKVESGEEAVILSMLND